MVELARTNPETASVVGEASMPPTVTPLSRYFGAAITGLDIKEWLEAGDRSRLLDFLHRYDVLVFRNQNLGPGDLTALSRLLGDPEEHVLRQYVLPDHPEVYVLSNIVENGRSVGNPDDIISWHSDLQYMAVPTAYTCLYGIEVPPVGGETWFASTFAAYEALSDEMKRRIDGLRLHHSYARLYASKDHLPPMSEEQRRRTPDVDHPLVRTHPVSGRKAIYIGGGTVVGVLGMSEDESTALLQDLKDHVTSGRFVYRHAWQPGDLVMWDNRGTLHTPTPYDHNRYRRLVYRVTARGEVPF